MKNSLLNLMEHCKKGSRSTINMGPFLSIIRMHEMGLRFNDVLCNADDMAAIALSNLDFGFESTVLPIDLNVEAEVLGAQVRYYEEIDGNPIYPTIARKWVSKADDIVIPENIAGQGRLPAITRCIKMVKDRAAGHGAVGVFIPGPFTLAGQLMDMDELFIMFSNPLKYCVCAKNICFNKRLWVCNTSIHMGFSCKIYNKISIFYQTINLSLISDVIFDKVVILIFF